MNQTVTLIKELSAIIVSLLGALSVIIVAYINAYHQRKTKQLEIERDSAKKEVKKLKLETTVLDLWFRSGFSEFTQDRVIDIFERTKANRFLLLFAINGKEDFNTATVVYERTRDSRSEGAMGRYIRLPIDDYYRDMLKKSEKKGAVDVHTNELPKDSLLYKIYSSPEERVTHSRVKFIKRMHVDDDNDLLLYASIGTHEADPFTEAEIYEIKIAINAIRNKAADIKIQ